MRPPDAERGPRQAPGPDQATAKQAESENDSSITALPVDPYGVAMLDVELAELLGRKPVRDVQTTQAALTDVERIAFAYVHSMGPTWSRRLAFELLDASAELLGDRRNTWGGDGCVPDADHQG